MFQIIKYNSFFKVKQAISQQFPSTSSSSLENTRKHTLEKKKVKKCNLLSNLHPRSIYSVIIILTQLSGIMTMICSWCNELWNNLLSWLFIRLVSFLCGFHLFYKFVKKNFFFASLSSDYLLSAVKKLFPLFCLFWGFFCVCLGLIYCIRNKWSCRCFWHS